MDNRIDQLTLHAHNETGKIFNEMKTIELITINAEIACARLGDLPDARALYRIAEIINEKLVALEDSTRMIKDSLKEIAEINRLP